MERTAMTDKLNPSELLQGVTPGDWHVGNENGYSVNQIIAGPDVGICLVYGIWAHTRVDDPELQESAQCREGLANARLLASSKRLAERVLQLERYVWGAIANAHSQHIPET